MGDLVKFPAARTETCPHCIGMGRIYDPVQDDMVGCALCKRSGVVTLAEKRSAPPPTFIIPVIGPKDA